MKLKKFSIELTKGQYEILKLICDRLDMRWCSDEKLSDWNPWKDGAIQRNPIWLIWDNSSGFSLEFKKPNRLHVISFDRLFDILPLLEI